MDKNLLNKILRTFGPSGHEEAISQILRDFVAPHADEVYSDNYESEQTSDIELVTDEETGESYYTVSFDNTLKRIEHGSGISNKYEKDASGNFHLQYRIKDGTNTEEPK